MAKVNVLIEEKKALKQIVEVTCVFVCAGMQVLVFSGVSMYF